MTRIGTTCKKSARNAGYTGLSLVLCVLGVQVLTGTISQGATDRPAEEGFVSLSVTPSKTLLRGPDSVQQLAVDGILGDARRLDLTAKATFESSNPSVASVDASGMIAAHADGQATIRVLVGTVASSVPVDVKDHEAGLPINFTNQVVPVFTKLGCNSGGCHGKASGQNGFRLSLLGFEPTLDYETLVKEGRGRRVFPIAPERSLLLTKATATVPHGGGRKMEVGSHEYGIVRRWIASGLPFGKESDPTVARIEVYPDARVLSRGSTQQMVVTAVYSDGTTEDVTRWAQYQSNDTEVATVADGGRVESREMSGQAAVMARYQGQVAVFRASVPLGLPIDNYPEFASSNVIDTAALPQWKALGLVPSPSCTDAEFIRRASLDVTGSLPSADETRGFVNDTTPGKRDQLVDRLLERPEYASFFAVKWADLLRNKRDSKEENQHGTFTFFDWIRQNLARNTPYDRFVRQILAASGTPESAPPVQWYRSLKAPDAFVDDTAQVFLGMRLQCAKCHHHPFEKWGQDDYYGFAAFFARVGRKPLIRPNQTGEIIFAARTGAVQHPKTGQMMAPKGLGSAVVPVPPTADPRQKLVDWMADPKNPFFARAVVNRYWSHFFGRGVVEPMDDLRQTNPASNPALLDALADDFVHHGYDLKHLVRTICTSRTYGLSSVPNEYNAKDRQSFARHYPKRLTAEVLLDAISAVTESPTAFNGLPPGTRAIELPDESVASTFLDTFGRPKRDTPCECERVTDASLGQSLMLLNSGEVQNKLGASGSRADRLAKDPRPDPEKLEELFWAAFGRAPTSGETASALNHLAKNSAKRKDAFEDILWALINAKEFQFND